ncbi:hypothetical protein Back2_20020 [Nocardioides baekrokdamisoli]|uniref:Uncharacterized protein n=2 Tax=Nocardioides baekrokdamisoli TaxID=1804624 RepID=A0A3G9INU7_9ACTN|nr:hypothetical protein Back2_20020 [Nocardioides baekrokdamisoli]
MACDPIRLRRVVWAVVAHAAVSSTLSETPTARALGCLVTGETVSADLAAAVERVVIGLDGRAFDVHDREGDSPSYLAAFSRARAAAAVGFAISADLEHDAAEAVYEAWAATGDIETVRAVFALVLP